MEKKFDISIIIVYAVATLLLILKSNEIYMYIALLMTFFIHLIKNLKNKKNDPVEFLCVIAIYSVIMPDNYIIIAISCILLIAYIIKFLKNKNKVNYGLVLILLVFIVNTLITDTKPINVFFYIIFNFTFIIYYFIFKSRKEDKNFKVEISKNINNIIIIEIIATIFRVIFEFNIVMVSLGSDWSIGTLGVSQGNILMIIFTFYIIRYVEEYLEKKSKKTMVLIVLSVLVALSTASIANDMVLVISIVIYVLFNYKINIKTRFLYLFLTITGVFIFYTISPDWVKSDVKNLANIDFIQTRIKKVKSYSEVFVDIPKNNISFLLFGNGAGYYSSRAALICTGKYVEGYTRFFSTSISEYTYINIYNNIVSESYNQGVEEAPYSTIISIMGEFGVVGLIIFLIFFTKILKEVKHERKLIIIFFIGMCFIDNWIEFAKVVMFLWFAVFI